TGGNCMARWWEIPNLAEVGFPIVEAEEDGTFVVTKHPGSGGVVSRASVTEQLLYEIADPRAYVGPDVTADFTTIQLAEDGPDRVRVTGATGSAPPVRLKVSVAYAAGWRSVGTLTYAWPDAAAKARAADRVIRARLERLGLRFDETRTELVGWDSVHGPLVGPPPADLPEVQLRIAVRSEDRAMVERFTREIAPLVLTGPPSVTGYATGRPRVDEIVAFWPALIDRSAVEPHVRLDLLRV
ncbi:MAG TPA: acyclic terpene utilization AtuA family protein, partial [Longimicrobiales bacterium]|nr:acyclic terpene utilization AtuA family protein [Longimicrobiales bacterium]